MIEIMNGLIKESRSRISLSPKRSSSSAKKRGSEHQRDNFSPKLFKPNKTYSRIKTVDTLGTQKGKKKATIEKNCAQADLANPPAVPDQKGCEKQQILAISRLSNARLDSNWMNSGQNFSSEQDSSTLELPTVEQDEDPTLLQLDDLIQNRGTDFEDLTCNHGSHCNQDCNNACNSGVEKMGKPQKSVQSNSRYSRNSPNSGNAQIKSSQELFSVHAQTKPVALQAIPTVTYSRNKQSRNLKHGLRGTSDSTPAQDRLPKNKRKDCEKTVALSIEAPSKPGESNDPLVRTSATDQLIQPNQEKYDSVINLASPTLGGKDKSNAGDKPAVSLSSARDCLPTKTVLRPSTSLCNNPTHSERNSERCSQKSPTLSVTSLTPDCMGCYEKDQLIAQLQQKIKLYEDLANLQKFSADLKSLSSAVQTISRNFGSLPNVQVLHDTSRSPSASPALSTGTFHYEPVIELTVGDAVVKAEPVIDDDDQVQGFENPLFPISEETLVKIPKSYRVSSVGTFVSKLMDLVYDPAYLRSHKVDGDDLLTTPCDREDRVAMDNTELNHLIETVLKCNLKPANGIAVTKEIILRAISRKFEQSR